MGNIKQYLKDKISKNIEETEKQIEESNKELRILEAELKVEKKFSELEDIAEVIKDDVKYSVQAIESMLAMEQNKNEELKKELKILRTRKQVIDKFEEEDF